MQTYKLLKNDTVLLSQPLLIEHFGRAATQVLSQIHYWQKKNESLWIYNTAKELAKQCCLSIRHVRRILARFSELEILKIDKQFSDKRIRTNSYAICHEKISIVIQEGKDKKSRLKSDLNGQNVTMQRAKMSPCNVPKCHHGNTPEGLSISQFQKSYPQQTTDKDINKSNKSDNFNFDSEENMKIITFAETTLYFNQAEQSDYLKNLEQNPEETEYERKARERQELSDRQAKRALMEAQMRIEQETSQGNVEKDEKKPRTTTVQDMLKVWNETLGEKNQATMSKELAPLLVSAYAKKFERKLDHWRRYCALIKTSAYLMGEKFKLSMFWALKFGIIDRLRSGDLGVKVSELQETAPENDANDLRIEQMIEAVQEPQKSKEVRRLIAEAVGGAVYHSWFHSAKFEERNGEVRLVAPNDFVEQYWETHFDWINK